MPFNPKSITCMILAGGKGTRLGDILKGHQKVIAEINKKPFLAYLLDLLEGAGIQRVVLCAGYCGEDIEAKFGEQYRSLTLVYSKESEPLGTGGAIRKALLLTDSDPILVMNGDSYCDVDLAAFVDWHVKRQGVGSLVLTPASDAGRFGRTVLDGDKIISFEEKVFAGPGWVNGGIYLLSRKFIHSIPEGRTVSIEREVFPFRTDQGLYGFRCNGNFLDIGTPESYRKAERFFKETYGSH